MSDPQRTPDILRIARNLPEGTALIYRHFGAGNRVGIAEELRQIAFARNLQFLIGQDADLAAHIGADGVHLPERALGQGAGLRARYPDWLLTGAAHSKQAVKHCAKNRLDVAILSPIFPSESKSADQPIGVEFLADMVKTMHIPIMALGGISAVTAAELYASGAAGIAGVSMFVSAYDP